MSFKIGQFRSSSSQSDSTYIVDNSTITYNKQGAPKPLINTISAGADITFEDKTISYNFTAEQNYYIKIKIKRIDSDQTITLRLAYKQDSATVDTYQFVDSYTIFTATTTEENQYAVIEAIVQSNSAYQQLNIILNRTSADFLIENQREGAIGREIVITDYEIHQLRNLIDKKCTKIGVQGPPNMLMCINGEGIRIGPSGIYEIKNGYIINFIGVVPKRSRDSTGQLGRDNFLIDYQYEDIN